jgi:hypothetical protein
MTNMESNLKAEPLRIRATHLAAMGVGHPIIVTYQNTIVGQVMPFDPPIQFPRGSTDAEIALAFSQALGSPQPTLSNG